MTIITKLPDYHKDATEGTKTTTHINCVSACECVCSRIIDSNIHTLTLQSMDAAITIAQIANVCHLTDDTFKFFSDIHKDIAMEV